MLGGAGRCLTEIKVSGEKMEVREQTCEVGGCLWSHMHT